jgi:transmembrane sensor
MAEPINTPEYDAIEFAAAEWVVRLQQSGLSLDDISEWQRWMRSDERHTAAFQRLEELWGKFDAIGAPPHPSSRALSSDAYDASMPVGEWRRSDKLTSETSAAQRRFATRTFSVAACAVLARVVVVSGGVFYRGGMRQTELARQMIETAVGENRSVTLADGSSVALGGHTRLSFSLRANVREIMLENGEAFFAVAKDPSRPFQVHAGNATVTAVGTEFDVRRSDDNVTVAVLEGRVMVQPMAPLMPVSWLPASRPVGQPAALAAGERTTVNRNGVELTSELTNAQTAIEWQDGQLAFEGESLRYVVQDVNRYASKPIVLADEKTATLRITGTISSSNVLGWVRSLQPAFGVRAEIEPNRIVLRKE